MNSFDERTLRQRLKAELGSVAIPPAPVVAATRQGRAIRARRRALAGGLAVIAVAAVLAARFIGAPGPAPAAVTLNAPRPGAPGGVFASGTAHGHPWQLAVRNIAADPGTSWCLPAVMLNGRDGNVLFKADKGTASFDGTALLFRVPGLPGFGALLVQVPPQARRLAVTFLNGRSLSVDAVWVSACGQRFHLAGFVYANSDRGIRQLSASPSGMSESLSFAYGGSGSGSTAGVWLNFDNSRADVAASQAYRPIGTGTVGSQRWQIDTSLGLFGQCYRATALVGGVPSRQCVPVAAPPAGIVLDYVLVQGWNAQYTGYAGLVSPRTAKVTVTFSGAPDQTLRPVNVTGRKYIAFVVPPGCDVIRITLANSAGHTFARTALPPAP